MVTERKVHQNTVQTNISQVKGDQYSVNDINKLNKSGVSPELSHLFFQ